MIMSDGNQSAKAHQDENPTDESLKELLNFFGAATLGDGNLNAGANTLAAMALTLANLSHPDSRAMGGTSQSIALGCSFFATGSLTPALISDCVVGPVAAAQGHLNWQMAEHRRILGLRSKFIAEGDNMNSAMDPHRERERAKQITLVEDVARGARPDRYFRPTVSELIRGPAHDREEDRRMELLSRHAYFICGESLDVVRGFLQSVHLDRPLVTYSLNGTKRDCNFGELATNVLDGFSRENTMAKGNLIVLDPGGIGNFGHGGSENRNAWLNRMLWLVDGLDVPGYTFSCDSAGHCECSGSRAFQVQGLHTILTSRLLEEGSTGTFRVFGIASDSGYQLTIGNYQETWCRMLLEGEERFPGIAHALRSLPASLIAGFGAMGFESRSGLQGLVRASYRFSVFLMERMILAHKGLCQSEKTNRQEALETRVLGTLEKKGASKSYHIAKNLSGVRTEECDQVLASLKSRGLVQRRDDKFWYLADSGAVARN